MSQTSDQRSFLWKVISILSLFLGSILVAYTTARLTHGPFPLSLLKITKIILGIGLILIGWVTGLPKSRQAVYDWLIASAQPGSPLRSFFRAFLFPAARVQGYPRHLRILLTVAMFAGISLTIVALTWALSSPHHMSLAALFLHRWRVMGTGGIVLAFMSGVLRYGEKAPRTRDWPKPMEIIFLFCLALVVTATDIYFSRKIGLLAFPPYYDGVQYMLDAKNAFLHLGLWKVHPITFANITFGNRYPVWQGLMVLNFVLFGEGEWQSYAARFWPTFVISLAVFWVVRRRIGAGGAWAAAILTSMLPTVSVNLQAAAAGHHNVSHGYLSDLRPDLLFAAFLLCAVVLLVERAHALDETTAVLSGACAALAVLTKSSALGALLLAWCLAAGYVFTLNRRNLKHVLQMADWALLSFIILLLPWALAGGLAMTLGYIRNVLTVELPLYSNPHATLKSELTYYWTLFSPHMGTLGLVLLFTGAAAFLFLFIRRKQRSGSIGPLFCYMVIGICLYALVSTSLAKNYFLALPCYLVLWVFSLGSMAVAISALPAWKTTFSWIFVLASLVYAGLIGIQGYRNLHQWSRQELQEGPYNQIVMRQIAYDLSKILSHQDSFMWTPEYGSPSTFLYYMPQRQDELPEVVGLDAMASPPPEQYGQECIEPAKAVLLLRGDIEKFNALGMGAVSPLNYPYFRAAAAWVRRPGSTHHLLRTYHFFGGDNNPELTVDLYVKNSAAPNPAAPNAQDQTVEKRGKKPKKHPGV